MYKPNKIFYKFLCMSLMFFCFNTNQTYAEQVCSKGYYVISCSGKTIGTYLLKGFYYQGSGNQTMQSPNYYDYSMTSNMENLRAFFSGTGTFQYWKRDGTTISTAQADDTENVTGYKTYRDKFFATYCPNANSILCAKCPNGGKTDFSSISMTADGSTTVWHLNFISDCYVSQYTDSTGSYEYIADTTNLQTLTCYYDTESNDRHGYQFISDDILFPPDTQSQTEHGSATGDDS